jgi:Zn-finger nucleic acid-binding protein
MSESSEARERHCVVCDVGMVTRDVDGVEVDLCPACHGLWLDKDEVQALAAKDSDALAELREQMEREAIPSGAPLVERPCPACRGKLTIAALSAVHVRHCSTCDGIFLERNELDRALAAFEGSENTTVVAVARTVVARGLIES